MNQKNVGDNKAKHDGLLKSMLSLEESIKSIKEETEVLKAEKASTENKVVCCFQRTFCL